VQPRSSRADHSSAPSGQTAAVAAPQRDPVDDIFAQMMADNGVMSDHIPSQAPTVYI
jgi:hypothetical protein